ncbi:MAG: glutathione S-transferase family protein [Silicimonas sp.]|nr:glutathione S-transferase family protein [Silicimonas sp.]NND18936.1 glutathione S-transferase family protein [Silicimonas sp.]NNL34927.1 glutathione S-transferase family protein [Silicimonas sp.]NNL71918.1 glutathione S-transferase family protein [Silicimonas sp.]
MKLYTNPASPFCRKVEVVLHECGQADAVETIGVAGHPTDTGTMPVNVNPIGKIPTLERRDGPALYDSRVIARFLDSTYSAGLYPDTRLWDVLTLEATGDGICDAAVLMVYEGRSRPEDKQHQPYVDGQWDKITRALDALEDRWISLLSGPLNIGQIAVGCALGYLDFRHAERDWRTGRPQLAAWFERFGARPSMTATKPPAA